MLKKIIGLVSLLVLIAGCRGTQTAGTWNVDYDESRTAGAPTAITSPVYFGDDGTYGMITPDSYYEVGNPDATNTKTVVALLPLSGADSALGREIQNSMTLAFLQKRPKNIILSFYDISGSQSQKANVMTAAISKRPDLILGPIFAKDAEMLSRIKSDETPALSFTSDWTAVGSGIETMSLLPYQGVEAISQRIAAQGRKNVLIIAPRTDPGYGMARAAQDSISTYGMSVKGLLFYESGNQESMKNVAQNAAMHSVRVSANDKAKQIVSDILLNERITARERDVLTDQLDQLSKQDTIGALPYDAVLFLGDAGDSKTLASFLRYFDVTSKDAKFFGTATWDSEIMFTDLTLIGSEYPTLPPMNTAFVGLYNDTYGAVPSRISSMGYDAAMIAISALQSDSLVEYLLDPSGYKGLDGIIRLKPDGTNERALQIMQLRANGTPVVVQPVATSFIKALYRTDVPEMSKPSDMNLSYYTVDPTDYIEIPREMKYRYQVNIGSASKQANVSVSVPVQPDTADAIYDESFTPLTSDPVDRRLIDSVEIN